VSIETEIAAPSAPSPPPAESFATLAEAFEIAKGRLAPEAWDFLEGGAGDEVTLRANRTEFDRWQFRPRTMSGRAAPGTATTVLGIPLGLPVLTAPFGTDGMFDPEGHKAVARANAAFGTVSIVPEAGTHSIEQVAEAAPAAARIAQLHPMGDPGNYRAMLDRIAAAGYGAICVTVDCPTGGWRERNLRNRFEIDPRVVSGNYPGWARGDLSSVFGQLFTRSAPVWSWDDLAEHMQHTHLPWMAKGILTGEDAVRAVGAGASAVLVSNHGGRQLDGTPPALTQLPEVVAAVGDRTEILLDSGIRRGTDIVKAIALGARAVVIGRLAAVGLAAGGQPGLERVLSLLRDEVTTVLTLLGRGSIDELDASALVRSAP
jgi:4-hydroxymandelate oxidase